MGLDRPIDGRHDYHQINFGLSRWDVEWSQLIGSGFLISHVLLPCPPNAPIHKTGLPASLYRTCLSTLSFNLNKQSNRSAHSLLHHSCSSTFYSSMWHTLRWYAQCYPTLPIALHRAHAVDRRRLISDQISKGRIERKG